MQPQNQPPQPQQETPSQVPGSITPKQAENLTVNTTSVVSKVGLYARVTFFDLWILVLVTCGSIDGLIYSSSGRSGILVTMISALIVTIPIFVIANSKRAKEISHNPQLVDDIFLKKYLRKNLFIAIFATAISGFSLIYTVLSLLLLSSSGSSNGKTKALLDSLSFTLGFAVILAFSWKQHARTTK